MAVHPLAGKPVPESLLPNIPRLMTAYFTNKPDVSNPAHKVSFGDLRAPRAFRQNPGFNENHILAITQAVCEYRSQKNIKGPLYIGYGYARPFRKRRWPRPWKFWPPTRLRPWFRKA